MTTENELDVRGRVEKAIGELVHESGMSLPVMLGQAKTIELRDRVVREIMTSNDPDMCKLVASGFVRNCIVHNRYGSFTPGPDGKLRVRLR
jgi:hypothetical protein